MAAFDRVLLVANPISGSRRAGRSLNAVADAFESAGCKVDRLLTQRPNHAREAAGDYAHDNALIVAFGGDGTFNEILNGADLERSILAVIPAGTGNVLAKEIGVARSPAQAARQLVGGRVVRLDLAVCNGRRFVSMFGAGLDGWVVEAVHAHRTGRHLSQLHYVPHVVRCALAPGRWEIEVEVDGRPLRWTARQVSVGNAHSYGGPIELTPAASPSDGLLDVMAARWENALDAVRLGTCGLLRSLHLNRGVEYRRGRRVVVSAPGQRVFYQVDGDAAGQLPAEIGVSPGAVRLLVPAPFRAVRRAAPFID